MPVRARNVFRVVVALSLILAFSAAPMTTGWMAGDNMPITPPVILQLGWDEAVKICAEQLHKNIPLQSKI